MNPLTTFLIVLLAAVGVISLRRVWRKLRELDEKFTYLNKCDNQISWSNLNRDSVVRHMDKRITQLESERKD